MRQPQKTEQADRQWRTDLEDQRQTGARSMVSGENNMMGGTKFQSRVLDRNNLNQAYLRVVRNKGAAGVDGMTVDDLLPFLRKHREELLERLADGGLTSPNQSNGLRFQSPMVACESLAYRP